MGRNSGESTPNPEKRKALNHQVYEVSTSDDRHQGIVLQPWVQT